MQHRPYARKDTDTSRHHSSGHLARLVAVAYRRTDGAALLQAEESMTSRLVYGLLALLMSAPNLVVGGECDCTSWDSCHDCESSKVVEEMAAAPHDSAVQHNGCWALYWRPPEEVVDASGIDAIAAAMEALPYDGNVQHRAVNTLARIANDRRKHASPYFFAEKVAQAGGIRLAISAMDQALEHRDNDSKDLAGEINWHGCHLLAGMSKNGQHKAVVDGGGIQAVMTAMKFFPLVEGVPVNGCRMLHLLFATGFRKEVQEAGAEAAARVAMSAIPQNSVREKCEPLSIALRLSGSEL